MSNNITNPEDLTEISDRKRKELVSKNRYNRGNIFSESHPDALSDGDRWGKGENDGDIGNSIDMRKRKELTSKNGYNRKDQYDVGADVDIPNSPV